MRWHKTIKGRAMYTSVLVLLALDLILILVLVET